MSEALPTGWSVCTLGDVVKVQNGYAFPSKDFQATGVPLIRQSNLAGDKVSLEKCVYLGPNWVKAKPDFILRKDDVLIGMSGSVGKLCVYDLDQPALQNQRTGKIIPLSIEFVDWRYIWQFLKGVEQQLLEKGKGMGVLNVSAADIESLPLHLAPLGEQRRIVAKLETMLGKVDACQRRLAKIPRLLKRFRQSVLAAACSGRLTADWRGKNSAAPREENDSRGGAEELPETWRPASLGALTSLVTSGSRGWAEFYSDSGAIFIRAQDISGDTLNLTAIAHVSLPNKAEGLRTRVQRNDLLVTITGANVTKSARVEVDLDEAYVSQHVALVRLKDSSLSRFVFFALVSPGHGRKQLTEAAYGQGKPGLNLENIRSVRVALPPLPEQQEIVRRVEQLFTLADQLEARYAKAQAYVDKLTPSLLAKAFRGELVPQDPNDEPASALLARLRSGANGQSKPRRGKAME